LPWLRPDGQGRIVAPWNVFIFSHHVNV
jgi:hypothetical protein